MKSIFCVSAVAEISRVISFHTCLPFLLENASGNLRISLFKLISRLTVRQITLKTEVWTSKVMKTQHWAILKWWKYNTESCWQLLFTSVSPTLKINWGIQLGFWTGFKYFNGIYTGAGIYDSGGWLFTTVTSSCQCGGGTGGWQKNSHVSDALSSAVRSDWALYFLPFYTWQYYLPVLRCYCSLSLISVVRKLRGLWKWWEGKTCIIPHVWLSWFWQG